MAGYNSIYRINDKTVLKANATIHLTDSASKLKGALSMVRTSHRGVWPAAGPLWYAGIAVKSLYAMTPQRGIVVDLPTFVELFGKSDELIESLKEKANELVDSWNENPDPPSERRDISEDYLVKELSFPNK